MIYFKGRGGKKGGGEKERALTSIPKWLQPQEAGIPSESLTYSQLCVCRNYIKNKVGSTQTSTMVNDAVTSYSLARGTTPDVCVRPHWSVFLCSDRIGYGSEILRVENWKCELSIFAIVWKIASAVVGLLDYIIYLSIQENIQLGNW